MQIGGSMGSIAQHFSALTEAIGASARVFELIERVPGMPSILDVLDLPDSSAAGWAGASGAALPVREHGGSGAEAGEGVRGEGGGEGEGVDVPRVEFENVSFAYASSPARPILSGFSLRVPRGATFALVGQSGAGKSTVSSLLLRMYAPSSGRVLLDGHDLASVDARALRRLVGVVAQEPVLFAGSIFDNICYGARAHAAADAAADAAHALGRSAPPGTAAALAARALAAAAAAAAGDAELRRRVEEVAARAHCSKFISGFADGFETLVGERGVRLSGGQKQRVAIARALLENPPVLVLDEATSALDAESEALVVAALEALTVGRTTIVIAHRCVCAYLEVRPSPDRSPSDPIVEKHSDPGTFAEHTGTVATREDLMNFSRRSHP
ncbi:P-loop containing nucleoside triphosphate hydrolase protein [Pavlovales sp. CCMP2436]|nr:P-loop containing nucleoside triphosphate hydrolase protein [Pavlovales sp. CCMP2436]